MISLELTFFVSINMNYEIMKSPLELHAVRFKA